MRVAQPRDRARPSIMETTFFSSPHRPNGRHVRREVEGPERQTDLLSQAESE